MKIVSAKLANGLRRIWCWDLWTALTIGGAVIVVWPWIRFSLEWISVVALLTLCIACHTLTERSKIDMVTVLFQTSYGEVRLTDNDHINRFLAVFPITRWVTLLAATTGIAFIWATAADCTSITTERFAAGFAALFIAWMLLGLATVQIYQDKMIATAAKLLAFEQRAKRAHLTAKRKAAEAKSKSESVQNGTSQPKRQA